MSDAKEWEWGWNEDLCAVWGVAIVLAYDVPRNEQRASKEKRARLISAAPDLLDALRDACITYAAYGDQPPQQWLDAIAKATGEPA